MHLTAFNARALTDVAAAVKSLESQGAAELVLDLRDNRGGLVQEGIEIAKLFLEGEAARLAMRRPIAGDQVSPAKSCLAACEVETLGVLVHLGGVLQPHRAAAEQLHLRISPEWVTWVSQERSWWTSA